MTSQLILSERDYLILASISPQPLHGYAITRLIKELTAEALVLSPGTLYKALDRLLAKAWIEVSGEEIVNSRLRRYYRLTSEGHDILEAEAARRTRMEREVRRRLRRPTLGESL